MRADVSQAEAEAVLEFMTKRVTGEWSEEDIPRETDDINAVLRKLEAEGDLPAPSS